MFILKALIAFANWIWGIPMLLVIVGGGFVMSARMGFPQFTRLGFILKHTIGKSFGEKGKDGQVSGWQAVTGVLASTLGAGNIVGTAMAVAFGGPGGLFWLWLSALFCSMVKFCEVTMAMKYRRLSPSGKWEGGPQIYLAKATGWKWTSLAYAICCGGALFIASSAQIGAGVDNLVGLGTPRIPTTFVLTALVGVVVIGGINSLVKVTEKMVPLMSVIYVVGCLAVIGLNIGHLPEVIGVVFKDAFTGRSAFGGFAGATIMQSIRWGVARGCYSNDAGNGTTTIVHAAADVNHPVQQGMWGIFEVFASLVVCTMSSLVVLCTNVWSTGIDPSIMTATAFEQALGHLGFLIVSVSVLLFTFSTACAQVEFTEAQLVALLGDVVRGKARWVMLLLILGGGFVGISVLIPYIDVFASVNTLINMFGVYYGGSQIVALFKEYFADPQRWEQEKLGPWVQMEKEYAEKMQDAK